MWKKSVAIGCYLKRHSIIILKKPKKHMVVTIVNVIDANNFTINVNTLSYSTFTYTALTSYAKKYIQGTENITWDGMFYLPVRFKEDVITTSYDTFNSLSVAVTLVELRLDEVNEYELDD